MKGDITRELPAVIDNGEPIVTNGEPPQQSGAILWMALGVAVSVVLILACLVGALQ